jgi:hypothetical protein
MPLQQDPPAVGIPARYPLQESSGLARVIRHGSHPDIVTAFAADQETKIGRRTAQRPSITRGAKLEYGGDLYEGSDSIYSTLFEAKRGRFNNIGKTMLEDETADRKKDKPVSLTNRPQDKKSRCFPVRGVTAT